MNRCRFCGEHDCIHRRPESMNTPQPESMNTPQPEPAERYTRYDSSVLLNGLEVIAVVAGSGKDIQSVDELLALANSVPALREQVRRYQEGWKYLLSGGSDLK